MCGGLDELKDTSDRPYDHAFQDQRKKVSVVLIVVAVVQCRNREKMGESTVFVPSVRHGEGGDDNLKIE